MDVSADVCAMSVPMPKETKDDIKVPLEMELQDAVSGPTWDRGSWVQAHFEDIPSSHFHRGETHPW